VKLLKGKKKTKSGMRAGRGGGYIRTREDLWPIKKKVIKNLREGQKSKHQGGIKKDRTLQARVVNWLKKK